MWAAPLYPPPLGTRLPSPHTVPSHHDSTPQYCTQSHDFTQNFRCSLISFPCQVNHCVNCCDTSFHVSSQFCNSAVSYSYGQVSVQLRNVGTDAFRRTDYGDSIIVERRISIDGGSSYKIKSAKGELIVQFVLIIIFFFGGGDILALVCEYFQVLNY